MSSKIESRDMALLNIKRLNSTFIWNQFKVNGHS